MAGLTLRNVGKSYGTVSVMSGLDLDIHDGEFLVLVGPSGCGKSTLLRMIAGLEEITDGTISIGDTVVNDLPAAKRELSMVFQSYALYPHMSVRKNLAFGWVPASALTATDPTTLELPDLDFDLGAPGEVTLVPEEAPEPPAAEEGGDQ